MSHSPLHGLFTDKVCWEISWALLHSIWQIGLIIVAAGMTEILLTRRNSRRSYVIYVFALMGCLLTIPLNLVWQRIDSISDRSPTIVRSSQNEGHQTYQIPAFDAEPKSLVDDPESNPIATNSISERMATGFEESQATRQTGRGIRRAAVATYLLGVGFMLLRLLGSSYRAQRLVVGAVPIRDKNTQLAFQNACRAMEMTHIPSIKVTTEMAIPLVVGLWAPTILLPVSIVSGLSVHHLELILIHELAHVRRRDLWVNLLQRIAEACLFFNPAIWFLSRRIDLLREYCCDDEACSGDGTHHSNRIDYVNALVRVVELSGIPNTTAVAVAAVGRRPSQARRRIARLLETANWHAVTHRTVVNGFGGRRRISAIDDPGECP